MKRRLIWVSPIAVSLVGFAYWLLLDWLKAQMPWSVIVIFLIVILLYIWAIWGNIIFCPWKWSKYTTIKVKEIEVPEDKLDKVLGTPKQEGRVIRLEGKIVKRKIKRR